MVALDLNFKSFDDYLGSLSRATRKDLKRKFKKLAGAPDIRMEVHRDPGGLVDEIYELYLETFEKSEIQFEKLTQEFFQEIPRRMPEEVRYFLWWIDGRLAA